MAMSRSCVLAFGVALLVVTARSAAACDCDAPAQTCTALARATTVFVGTVVDVVATAPHDLDASVEVEEVFRGAPAKRVTIRATGLGGSCHYGRYKVGERMLIFASGSASPLSVSACSRTAPVAEAASELAELRRAARRGTGTISGTLTMPDGAPRPGVEVRVAGTTIATRSHADGGYQLEVPPGTYTVEPAQDPAMAPHPRAVTEIAAAGACATLHFFERWNGRIRGALRDPRGRPAANVLVRAFPVGASVPPTLADGAIWTIGTAARSDPSGHYELGSLPPGSFHVAVGTPFDPADPVPATIHPKVQALTRGGLVTGVDLVVPPRLPMVKISGKVTLAGDVAGGVNLEIALTEPRSRRSYTRYRSGSSPTFEFTEVAGSVVELRACANELDRVTRRIDARADTIVDLPLTIPRPSGRAP